MATRVLLIHGASDLGGAERELLVICDRLGSYGYMPMVVLASEGVLNEELRKRNVETFFCPMPPWRKLWGFWGRAGAVSRLRELIKQVKPALLHVNDIWWVPQTVKAASGLGIPILAHVRQEIEPQKVRRYWLDRVEAVVAVSQQVHGSLREGGVRDANIKTVYSGLSDLPDPSRYDIEGVRAQLRIPDKATVIGTVANLFPRKGYEVMLKAFSRILADVPDVEYVIVGGGNQAYEEVLRNLARSLNVQDRVHFMGAQPSVQPYLALMDLYVHPAVMEGFGIAVLEAMAMGKAVVATKTGGVPEIVVDGETGMLVGANNANALASAVVRMLKDRGGCRRMGEAGLQRVRTRFTADGMMQALTDVYAAILSPSQHSPHMARA